MIDSVRIQPDLALKRVEALYRYDGHGRLTSINEWNGGAAPRFFLMRTVESAICRFRADLPNDIVSRLEALCSREPVGDLPGKLPAHHAKYLELLSSHAPVGRVWAGPVYMSTRDLPPSAPPIAIDDDNAHLLRDGFEDWMPDVPHRRPFSIHPVRDAEMGVDSAPVGVIGGGYAAAFCWRARFQFQGRSSSIRLAG